MEMIGHVDKPWLRHPPSWHFTLGSLLLAMILFSTIPAATSQIIGVDICACSPSVYTFQLNFSFTCNEQTVSDNPGVKDEDCFVQGLRQQDGVTDFVPNKVSTFEILELDANQNIIQSGYYQQGYFDGAKISYTSITGKPDAVQNLTVDQLPRGLQINIIAQNANEEDIINTWIVLFTNMCNAFPVFEVGDQDGWTLIVRFPGLPDSIYNLHCTHVTHSASLAWKTHWVSFVLPHLRHHLHLRRPQSPQNRQDPCTHLCRRIRLQLVLQCHQWSRKSHRLSPFPPVVRVTHRYPLPLKISFWLPRSIQHQVEARGKVRA